MPCKSCGYDNQSGDCRDAVEDMDGEYVYGDD